MWSCDNEISDWLGKNDGFEVEGVRLGDRSKVTWKEVTDVNCLMLHVRNRNNGTIVNC